MYCYKCGAPNDDNAYQCRQCGTALQGGGRVPPPLPQQHENVPNYLVPSILVTLFCCLPLGIPAIVFAAQVNSKLRLGDVEGAWESSRMAKTFTWWAFGVGLGITLLYVLFYMLVFIAQLAA
jgi:hypothetical protein